MSEIKLKKTNEIKYCLKCKAFVKIEMKGLDGFCPNEMCQHKLYSVDTRGR